MIADYAELVTEVAHRSGVTDVANRATMFVGMAEEYMRKALRIGSVDLIADFDGLATADTNWLLEESPETYLDAVLFQVYRAEGDHDRAAPVRALLDQALEVLFEDAKRAAYAGKTIVRQGSPL